MCIRDRYNPFFPEISGADCQHCHGGANFENDKYMNNGIDAEADIVDIGRQKVTENPADRAKFKVPSLRNIAVTAPYMHDGSVATLEDVIDQYMLGGSGHVNQSELIKSFNLTELEKSDLINFLSALTDEEFISNSDFK